MKTKRLWGNGFAALAADAVLNIFDHRAMASERGDLSPYLEEVAGGADILQGDRPELMLAPRNGILTGHPQ